jgi:hypothetical protein
VIGFRGLSSYPHLLRADAAVFENHSHSLVALALRAGLTEGAARLAAFLTALALLAVVRRVTKAQGPNKVFGFAVALLAGIVASPIVHQHYWVVLFVPLAAARPTAGWRWLLPLVFWISPVEGSPHGWQIALVLTLAASLVLSLRDAGANGFEASADWRHEEPKAPGLGRLGEPGVSPEPML